MVSEISDGDARKPRVAVWGLCFVGAVFVIYSCIAVAPLAALVVTSDQVIWGGHVASRAGSAAVIQVTRGGRPERLHAKVLDDADRGDTADVFRHRGSHKYTAVRRVEWLGFPLGVVVAGLPFFFARSSLIDLGPALRRRQR